MIELAATNLDSRTWIRSDGPVPVRPVTGSRDVNLPPAASQTVRTSLGQLTSPESAIISLCYIVTGGSGPIPSVAGTQSATDEVVPSSGCSPLNSPDIDRTSNRVVIVQVFVRMVETPFGRKYILVTIYPSSNHRGCRKHNAVPFHHRIRKRLALPCPRRWSCLCSKLR